MKRRIALLMFFAMFILMACNMTIMLQMPIPFLEDGNPTPTQQIVVLPSATPSGYIGYITPIRGDVNVRGGPNTSYPRVQVLKFNDELPVFMLNEHGWYQVEIVERNEGQAIAWVSGNVVKFRSVQ